MLFPALLFLYLQVRQEIVRYEMMERLEHARLHTITLHNSDIEWYEKDREILVGSILFDVHTYSRVNDSTTFVGLYDTEETEIKKQVTKLVENANDDGARELIIGKLMLQFWITNDDSQCFANLSLLYNRISYPHFSDRLLSPDVSIPIPPPKA